ncbi:hypothetical protein NDU88_010767 [Pleurodeles waltl]|uniref:Uncharacterized protein n=1 Tax=Pleurodeles waltl TaxID=8319 RepID=A0AAV7S244_PLEWA|nr:hypothetical protein NDU88_010767 [Pleurodeles waltl]
MFRQWRLTVLGPRGDSAKHQRNLTVDSNGPMGQLKIDKCQIVGKSTDLEVNNPIVINMSQTKMKRPIGTPLTNVVLNNSDYPCTLTSREQLLNAHDEDEAGISVGIWAQFLPCETTNKSKSGSITIMGANGSSAHILNREPRRSGGNYPATLQAGTLHEAQFTTKNGGGGASLLFYPDYISKCPFHIVNRGNIVRLTRLIPSLGNVSSNNIRSIEFLNPGLGNLRDYSRVTSGSEELAQRVLQKAKTFKNWGTTISVPKTIRYCRPLSFNSEEPRLNRTMTSYSVLRNALSKSPGQPTNLARDKTSNP